MFQPDSPTCRRERTAKTLVNVQIHYSIVKLQRFAHDQEIPISSSIPRISVTELAYTHKKIKIKKEEGEKEGEKERQERDLL